jgi:hypothetical protein
MWERTYVSAEVACMYWEDKELVPWPNVHLLP